MKFYVIGIDDNGERQLSPEISGLLSTHTLFSGGRRHYELMRHQLPEGHTWVDITVPLERVFEQYAGNDEIVVFASGDPLFFGFANTIRKRLPEAEIKLYPWFNSLQLLAHRLVRPYHDMHMVSLTGRPWHELDRALIEGREKIGILTDREKTPAAIAARMLEYGYDNYRMTVGECLGNPEERVRTFALPELKQQDFAFPNCILLEQTAARRRPFGIPEEEFHLLNGRVRMITKMPVRLLSLSMLDLHNRNRFWDIGFCTGSVSVEAKLQFPHLHITAFEQREEGRELLRANSVKFGTPGIEAVIGDFTTAGLSELEAPDAVFIGGHGGKMEEIVAKITDHLSPDGVIVFNSVSPESRALFESATVKCNLRIIKRCCITVDAHHPIEVIQASYKTHR